MMRGWNGFQLRPNLSKDRMIFPFAEGSPRDVSNSPFREPQNHRDLSLAEPWRASLLQRAWE